MTTKRKPGRPSLASSGRTSIYVHAPMAEVERWRTAAGRADDSLNRWIRDRLNEAVDAGETANDPAPTKRKEKAPR